MKTILCFGDSNTLGYDPRDPFGGCCERPWPDLAGELMGREMINAGSCGRCIPGSARERAVLLELLADRKPDRLMIMLGTNDILIGREVRQSIRNMERLLAQLQEAFPQLPIMVLSPPRMTHSGTEETLEQLTQGLEQAAGQAGAAFLDCRGWEIPLAFDGVHFTQDGHDLFARRLADEAWG